MTDAHPAGPEQRPGLAPLIPPTLQAPGSPPARRVLIVGGGYVGLYTALTLQKALRSELKRGQVQITVVDPRSYMTYQPFLPETAAGSLEARQVVVSLRRELKHCAVIDGRLVGLDHTGKRARIEPGVGSAYDLGYDVVVVAPGSIAKTLPIPGLAAVGIGFKQVEEAIGLRNHILNRLDAAASTADPQVRARALTFVFIGGGYAGIEAFAELEDMARYATRYYPNVAADDMHWLLVEAGGRILGEVSAPMATYTLDELRGRGMDVRLSTRLDSCVDGNVELSDGTSLSSDTVVWTAGVKPNPVLESTDLPLDSLHRIPCTADLRVRGVPDAWSAGDCAAVPDLTKGDGSPDSPTCAPNAQHAVRQARLLGRNIAHSLQGRPTKDYRHKYAGSVASLGLYKGVAEVYGVKLKGFPAWFMHRTYHLSRMPTTNRKVRILSEWTVALLFRRDVVSIGEIEMPTRDFRAAAGPVDRAADRTRRDTTPRNTTPRNTAHDRRRAPGGSSSAILDQTGADVTDTAGPGGRPTPAEERSSREEGLPAKTTRDSEQEVYAGDAPDAPTFGDTAEPVAPADEAVSRG